MRIAVCDDDQKDCEVLVNTLNDLSPTHHVSVYRNAVELLSAVKAVPAFDLIFLDIYMPRESGLTVAKELRERFPQTCLVFCTTSADHTLEAFSLGMIHYLVKPISVEAVDEAVTRATYFRTRQRSMLSVKTGRQAWLLYLDEIACITMASHKADILMMDGQTINIYVSLTSLLDQLDNRFAMLSRGIVVNMAFIVEMRATECVLRDGRTILLSRRTRADTLRAYNNYVFDCLSNQKR